MTADLISKPFNGFVVRASKHTGLKSGVNDKGYVIFDKYCGSMSRQ